MFKQAEEFKKLYKHWMNNAIGCIIVLLLSVITFFLNLDSLNLSITAITLCFFGIVGAKISFARADVNEKKFHELLVQIEKMEVDCVNLEETLVDNLVEPSERLTQQKKEETQKVNESFVQTHEEVEFVADEVRSVQNLIVKEETQISIEEEILDKITAILLKHDRDAKLIQVKPVGNYIDFGVKSSVLRLKLKGRKHYILSDLTKEDILSLGLGYEAPAKNENYQSRITLTSVTIIDQLEDVIIDRFDAAC
ncbi:MAG: hypothetical protein ACRCST_09490 [Turicibacter sp.]